MGDIQLVSSTIPPLHDTASSRSSGQHVSSIIRDLAIRSGHFKPDSNDVSDNHLTTSVRIQLGNALEYAIASMLARNYPDRYVQIGELEIDGIIGTPDLYDTQDNAIEEIKLTWMSSRHDAASSRLKHYWQQLRAYCHMFGTNLGRLHIVHVNGAYAWLSRGSTNPSKSTNDDPQYRCWQQTFTDTDLIRNWSILLKHGERMRVSE